MTTIIICAAAFFGVAALVGGVGLLLRGDQGRGAEERLQLLTGNGTGKPVAKENVNLLAMAMDEGPTILERLFQNRFNLRRFLEQADSPITPSKFLMISSGLAGAGAL